MSNNITQEKWSAVHDLVYAGVSLRQIAARVGISKITAQRHKKLIMTFGGQLAKPIVIQCPCGRVAGHRGWCSVRIAESPARKAFLAAWGRGSRGARTLREKTAPYFFVRRTSALQDQIRRELPDWLRGDLLYEVENEIVLGILAGQITLADVAAQAKMFIARVRKSMPNPWRDISIDAPLNDEGMTFADILAAPEPYSEDECFA